MKIVNNNPKKMNAPRIAAAQKALKGYNEPIEGRCAVIDLLTDLQHLCAQKGYDFDSCRWNARNHFAAEQAGNEI